MNALGVLGPRLGVTVAVGDLSKGTVACTIGRRRPAERTGRTSERVAAVLRPLLSGLAGLRGRQGPRHERRSVPRHHAGVLPGRSRDRDLLHRRDEAGFGRRAARAGRHCDPGGALDRGGRPLVAQGSGRTPWGPPPTAALPLANLASTAVVMSRFALADPPRAPRRPRRRRLTGLVVARPRPRSAVDWVAAPPMDAVDRASALRAYADETASCERCALASGRTQVVFGGRRPRRRPDARRRCAWLPRGRPGCAVRRAGGHAARPAARRDRARAQRRLPGERAQVPPAGKPGPAAGGDRRLRNASVPPDRARSVRVSWRRSGTSPRSCSPGRRTASPACTARSGRSTLGSSRVVLYPLYHPAAALYTPSMLEVLERDFARIPALLGARRS